MIESHGKEIIHPLMLQLFVFLIASAIIAYISRASLRQPRSHGFYRFFAWEFILGLVLLNIECWFCEPLAWHQLISWLLLCASVIPLVLGVQLLRSAGKPNAARDDTPMLAFEKTTQLVTVGVYKYIRHPLYSSLLWLNWGAFFKAPSALGAFLALAATMCLTATAKAEETENMRYFGAAYQTYIQRTKMFIPLLF
ncbi:MAG: isoprenylcysteine carboxylmethyltransferase family protein [Chloroflexi bacterium]|nr:isoprenylcysteine carboxylmethyltransferase family protein [Chloroflexota bacterium]